MAEDSLVAPKKGTTLFGDKKIHIQKPLGVWITERHFAWKTYVMLS